MSYKKELGNLGENIACDYLESKGFTVILRNYVIWGGEIDIVAIKNDKIYIFEVKTSKSHIRPEEHLNKKKILKVLKTAEHLVNYKLKELLISVNQAKTNVSYETLKKDLFYFHVICIELDEKLHVKRLTHLENIEI